MRNRGPERVLFFLIIISFFKWLLFFLSWIYCHWFPEMQGLPILVVVVVVVVVVFLSFSNFLYFTAPDFKQ